MWWGHFQMRLQGMRILKKKFNMLFFKIFLKNNEWIVLDR